MDAGNVKGDEMHRRFCYHCRKDIVLGGHQAGIFIGIDKIPVICPSCGKETGCFRSQDAISQRKAAFMALEVDAAKAKRFPGLVKAKRKDAWKYRVYGIPDDLPTEKNGSIWTHAAKGLDAFAKMTGGDDEEGRVNDAGKDLEDYDAIDEKDDD